MNLGTVLKLATKFVARGFIFKAGKKAAIRGGKTGIGAFSLLAGGYMAYTLLQKRKEKLNERKQISEGNKASKKKIVV